ncbi:MAG: mercury resistance system transport protein MerF [Candidatus Methylomirabilales bacterium]|nr:mercury resistance system transport protein MerF [candidate division NC10 bacterium]
MGAGITGICCVTPILPWLFGLVGLAAVTAYLDYLLLPLLFLFVGIALWGWQLGQRAHPGGGQGARS